MKFFVDTADTKDIAELAATGLICEVDDLCL